MAKKLVIVWLSLLMILFSSISIYASESIQGDFFERHVVVNGTEIINYNLQYPFITHNNATYFPLSSEMCQILGLTKEMDWESRTLKLTKTDSTRKNISSNWLKNNNVDVNVSVLSDVKLIIEIPESDALSGECVSDKEIDLTGTPILAAGNYLYVPVRALTGDDAFGWDAYYDSYYGICISTKEGVSAASYANKKESLRNKGLVNYIKSQNASLSTATAQRYVFLFQRAEDVYGISDKLIMAVASKESHFNTWAGAGRSGAKGMMQIMPATAARYGISENGLYNAKTSIDFGAMYISERINAYGGNWTKGLSAYNQGSVKVNRGTHSTAYASKIIAEFNKITNYLTQNGYVSK